MKNIIYTVYKNYIILSFTYCLNLKISSECSYVALGNWIIIRVHFDAIKNYILQILYLTNFRNTFKQNQKFIFML